jgi:hypothetical protein
MQEFFPSSQHALLSVVTKLRQDRILSNAVMLAARQPPSFHGIITV